MGTSARRRSAHDSSDTRRSASGPLPQHLPAEEAMELLTVVDAEPLAASISWTLPSITRGPSADANGLAAEEVQPVPLRGQRGVILGQATERLLELDEDGGQEPAQERGLEGLRLQGDQRGGHLLDGGGRPLDVGRGRSGRRRRAGDGRRRPRRVPGGCRPASGRRPRCRWATGSRCPGRSAPGRRSPRSRQPPPSGPAAAPGPRAARGAAGSSATVKVNEPSSDHHRLSPRPRPRVCRSAQTTAAARRGPGAAGSWPGRSSNRPPGGAGASARTAEGRRQFRRVSSRRRSFIGFARQPAEQVAGLDLEADRGERPRRRGRRVRRRASSPSSSLRA